MDFVRPLPPLRQESETFSRDSSLQSSYANARNSSNLRNSLSQSRTNESQKPNIHESRQQLTNSRTSSRPNSNNLTRESNVPPRSHSPVISRPGYRSNMQPVKSQKSDSKSSIEEPKKKKWFGL